MAMLVITRGYVYVHPNSSHQQYRSLNHGCSRHHPWSQGTRATLAPDGLRIGSFVDRLYHVIPDMLQSLGFHVNLSTADVQNPRYPQVDSRLTGYHLPVRAPSGLALAVSFALTHVDPSCNPRHNAHSAASVFIKAWNTATTQGTVPWLPRLDSPC